ncbi:MAG: deoxyribose-phosphate aldolase [Leptospiraceae bacterium]|nr:deoxyribose-phosphate aldolase [Leptospiraceae bacterium]MDW8307097.1 deoxyribose-phosphate aldolase [Leptospiraceae bacterium]
MHSLSARIGVDQVGIEERVARFKARSIKTTAKEEGIKLAISMIDLTTLEGKDTPGKVRQLCEKALRPAVDYPELPRVAAVCVYPNFIALAKKQLEGSGIKVACVSTSFPAAQVPLSVKLDDVRRAVELGADEVDMVINRGAFLAGEYNLVFDEIARVKEICGDVHLKVILETGELETYDNIRKASFLAMEAGADFIKTSTGKAAVNATMGNTLVMLEAIRDYYDETGIPIGMKPAGGIRTSKEALHYLVMVKETLGDAWLNPNYFRFGASTLLNDLLMQYAKVKTGAYQSADYFSIA